jgi:RNA-directed DNA polymerase
MDVDQATLDGTRPTSCSDCAEMTASKWPLAACDRALARRVSASWIFEGDIRGCFDNFGHGWLESHVPMDTKVLSEWLKAGYVESGKLFPTEAGTPQGGIASPTIANIALDGLEAVLTERFGSTAKSMTQLRVRLVRYADDCAPRRREGVFMH